MAFASALARCTSPDGDPTFARHGPHDRQTARKPHSWYIERVDIVAIRAFLAEQREPAALVLFDYVPRVDTELAIVRGQLVTLVDTNHAEWWKVRRNDRIGYVPSNFIERIDFLPVVPAALVGGDVPEEHATGAPALVV
jgi:hypothetical protein